MSCVPCHAPTTVCSGLLPKNNRKYTHNFTISVNLIALFYSKLEKISFQLDFKTTQLDVVSFLTC